MTVISWADLPPAVRARLRAVGIDPAAASPHPGTKVKAGRAPGSRSTLPKPPAGTVLLICDRCQAEFTAVAAAERHGNTAHPGYAVRLRIPLPVVDPARRVDISQAT